MSLNQKIASKVTSLWLRQLSLDQIAERLSRRRGVLGLCYHSLSSDLEDYGWRTSPEAFDAHLTFLKGIFDFVTSDHAVSLLEDKSLYNQPRPVVVLCFDDGYLDNWTIATEILEKHKVPATLFAARNLITLGGSTHMHEQDLRALAEHPLWDVGAHGLSHNVLTGLLTQERESELADCASWLSDLLGVRPKGFAYPLGNISESVVALASQHYDYAFSTNSRLSDHFSKYQIRRFCPTKNDDSLLSFARGIWGTPFEDGVA